MIRERENIWNESFMFYELLKTFLQSAPLINQLSELGRVDKNGNLPVQAISTSGQGLE